MQLVVFQTLCVCIHQAIKQEKVYTQEQVKLIHVNFSMLNSHITVIYSRFNKNTFMLQNRKIENNCNGFFQAGKLTKMTSVTKFYISKSFKK